MKDYELWAMSQWPRRPMDDSIDWGYVKTQALTAAIWIGLALGAGWSFVTWLAPR